jgi:hypothetical protein
MSPFQRAWSRIAQAERRAARGSFAHGVCQLRVLLCMLPYPACIPELLISFKMPMRTFGDHPSCHVCMFSARRCRARGAPWSLDFVRLLTSPLPHACSACPHASIAPSQNLVGVAIAVGANTIIPIALNLQKCAVACTARRRATHEYELRSVVRIAS